MQCSSISRQGSLQLQRHAHGESSSDFVDLNLSGADYFADSAGDDEDDLNFASVIEQFGEECDKLTKMVQQKADALKEVLQPKNRVWCRDEYKSAISVAYVLKVCRKTQHT